MNDHAYPISTGTIVAEAATLLAHDDPFPGGAVVPPIYQTSLFTFASYAEMADTFAGRRRQPIYSRGDNPTVMEFEARVAALEGAEAARGFSSGMAAISATVLAFVGAGERIVAVRNCYGDAYRLFERLLPRLDIKVDYVDGSDPDAVAAALPGAKLLYLESPTSMMFELQDIAPSDAAGARNRASSPPIDNSWATPIFQKPILHGVDLVLHSASKYLGGHSDTVAGVVAGSAAHIKQINEQTYSYLGGKLSPFEAWLLLRGLRTLPLRLPHHMKSGLTIAERLKAHPTCRAGQSIPPIPTIRARRRSRGYAGPVLLRGDRGHRHSGLRRCAEMFPHRRELGRAREPGRAGECLAGADAGR